MAKRYGARGALFQLGDGATPTEAFTTVAQVLTIGEISVESERNDATAMNDDWEQFLLGVKSAGEIGISILYDPNDSQHKKLSEWFNDQKIGNIKIAWPHVGPFGHEWQIVGAIRIFTIGEQARGNNIQASITLAPQGEPVLVELEDPDA